jgi:glucose-6-phosphate 1-dehydrogenase
MLFKRNSMQKAENTLIVIFGASGDLCLKKLIPALYALFQQNLMLDKFRIIGVGRTPLTTKDFRAKMEEGIRKYTEINHLVESKITEFLAFLSFLSLDPDDGSAYPLLKNEMDRSMAESGVMGNCLFYLSLPPGQFGNIARNLGNAGLTNETSGYRRLIVEKPFGYDLPSGIELNRMLHEHFGEHQLYRIDHYLGKETVQNILVMRFSNGIFEPLWNRNFIHHIEITSSENAGVEKRGGYYDHSGALRDMLQNHLLQVLGLVAMEPPSSIDADAIRNETLKVLQSLRPIRDDQVGQYVIRGQYVASHIRGESVKGYREEPQVNPDSRTETYVAMKLYIDNWRWGDVPFYIRTGKRLPTRVTEIAVHFRPTPHRLFNILPGYNELNQLIIRIQPDEGILLKFGLKLPGAGYQVKTVNMDFHYSDLNDIHLPSAYERLIFDAMLGDSTLYARADAVEAAWKFVDPVQKAWGNDPGIKMYGYPAGTWGPEPEGGYFNDPDFGWRYPCKNLTDDGNYCEL